MSETKMADADGNELAIGDRVQIAPQPAPNTATKWLRQKLTKRRPYVKTALMDSRV